jgi:hypothetical protein
MISGGLTNYKETNDRNTNGGNKNDANTNGGWTTTYIWRR